MSKLDVKALADQMIGAVKGYVERATAPLASRLAKVEAKALALDSAERRLSRHADHLAKLESRLQALERGRGTP